MFRARILLISNVIAPRALRALGWFSPSAPFGKILDTHLGDTVNVEVLGLVVAQHL